MLLPNTTCPHIQMWTVLSTGWDFWCAPNSYNTHRKKQVLRCLSCGYRAKEREDLLLWSILLETLSYVPSPHIHNFSICGFIWLQTQEGIGRIACIEHRHTFFLSKLPKQYRITCTARILCSQINREYLKYTGIYACVTLKKHFILDMWADLECPSASWNQSLQTLMNNDVPLADNSNPSSGLLRLNDMP